MRKWLRKLKDRITFKSKTNRLASGKKVSFGGILFKIFKW